MCSAEQVFLAHNISSVTVSHGLASDTSVTIVPTAATNVTGANRTVSLGGPWWDLSLQDVEMTTQLEDGKFIVVDDACLIKHFQSGLHLDGSTRWWEKVP
jgi:hypothetical protein